MRIRRLGWAGVEIECDGQTLLIDYVTDKSPMAPMLRSPDEPFPPSSQPGHRTPPIGHESHHAEPRKGS